MSSIVEMLDKVANSLEDKGLIKEAMEIDVLSNTLEAYEKEAWTAKNSPQYAMLNNVLKALEKNNAQYAKSFLAQGAKNKDIIVTSYGTFRAQDGSTPAQAYGASYDRAMQALEQDNVQAAAASVKEAMEALDKLEPIITQRQVPGQQQPQGQPQQAPGQSQQAPGKPQEMIFTNKPQNAGPVPRRVPLPNPGKRE